MKTKKIQIKDLKIGDRIKTLNTNGSIVFKEVTKKWNTKVFPKDQVFLAFENNSSLICSKNHPIMILDNESYIQEKKPLELDKSFNIISDSGLTTLKSIKTNIGVDENFIDITVENTHTFFASQSKDSEMILTHNSQGGIRKSSATLFFPIWHYEFQDLVVLKNDKGTPDTRATGLDYAVQINKFFYERLQKNQDISLFSPNEVPGLYEAFFQDQSEFKKLYEKYEKDKSIRRKVISAEEAFNSITLESLETGRIYIMNVDHSNEMSPFLEKKRTIYQSNLCVEITLPTSPLDKKDISVGEISLCTLGGINLGKIKKFQDMEYPLELVVRMLDSIISYQDYSIDAAKKASLMDRSLGIGVINFAYYLAKNKVVYGSQESLDLTHKVFEHFQYYLLKASNKLAKEFGKCLGFDEYSKYAQGILPIDKYKKSVDEITKVPLECDWDSLRSSIKDHGLRNNTLSSQFPSETSSQLSAATSGIEAIRDYILEKSSKDTSSTFVAPELKKYKQYYKLAWDIDQVDYIKVMAVIQKFIDQSISTNIYYDVRKTESGNISSNKMKRDLLWAYKYGLKTRYYCNSYIPESEAESGAGCESGACQL